MSRSSVSSGYSSTSDDSSSSSSSSESSASSSHEFHVFANNHPYSTFDDENDDECYGGVIDDGIIVDIPLFDNTDADDENDLESEKEAFNDDDDGDIENNNNSYDYFHHRNRYCIEDDEEESINEMVMNEIKSPRNNDKRQAYIPTAELITAVPTTYSNYNRKRKKKYCFVFTVILVSVIFISAIILPVISRRSNNVKIPPISAATTPSPADVNQDYADVMNFLFKKQVISLSALEKYTPEHYAVLFLAEIDSYEPSEEEHYDDQKFVERYVLVLLYYALHGNDWKNHYHFLSGRDHCEWNQNITMPSSTGYTFLKGVECNHDGYVIGLDLSNNNLIGRRDSEQQSGSGSGGIPQEITHLTQLRKLHLQNNKELFANGGSFPNIHNMKSLKSIGLMDVGLSGRDGIPEQLGTMTQLTTLGLSSNIGLRMSTIPKTFEKLKNLRILGLDGMELTGSINMLKGLSKLEALYLEDNHLTGELDGNKWSRTIQELDISNNMIDGAFPENLLQAPKLKVLDVHRNLFFGDFPSDIFAYANQDSLEYLAMNQNQMAGTLSDRIGFLKSLKHLHVGSNLLTGTIPDTISQLTNLITLSAASNKFSKQPLRDYYSKMTKLKDLSLKGNSLTGTLPDFFGSMTSLQLLDLDSNSLSGTIPTWYGLMTNLETLMLNRNEIRGTIPNEITNMSNLKILLLDGNNLTGSTNDVCQSNEFGLKLDHFVTDCYPGRIRKKKKVIIRKKSDISVFDNDNIYDNDNEQNGGEYDAPEIECRCCTLCCNDDNPNCNSSNKYLGEIRNVPYKSTTGYIRGDYDSNLDGVPITFIIDSSNSNKKKTKEEEEEGISRKIQRSNKSRGRRT